LCAGFLIWRSDGISRSSRWTRFSSTGADGKTTPRQQHSQSLHQASSPSDRHALGELAFFAHFSLRLAKAGRRKGEGCARTNAALAGLYDDGQLHAVRSGVAEEGGLVSPYLRSFVVARINPLRWIKGEPPWLEEVFKTMRERAAKFNVEKIKPQDLAGAAGPPDEEG
jgi:hypothetical protein